MQYQITQQTMTDPSTSTIFTHASGHVIV